MSRIVKRGKVYYAEYTDPERGFTTRRTTGTDDRREATRILGELLAKSYCPKSTTEVDLATVGDIVAAFYAKRKDTPSRYAMKAALSYVQEFIPSKNVEWYTHETNQLGFIKQLEAKGLAQGTIHRTQGIIGAALRQAYRRANSSKLPFIVTVKPGACRDRILTDDEARALIKAVETENERRLVLLALTTGSRPQALMDARRDQFDREAKLIDLNPKGRVQNAKKWRPIIPMTNAVYTACREWKDGAIFMVQTDHRKQLGHVKYVWNRLHTRAGLPKDVTMYTIRHTVATELRKAGVAEWDVSGYMGHKAPGSATTARYAHWRPDFMRAAADAMDAYWGRVNGQSGVDAGGSSEGVNPIAGSGGLLA